MTDREKDVLERRIDELCTEVERLHAEQVHWELGNCPSCPNVVSLQEALEQNAKLLELENIRISQVKFCEDLDAENAKLRDENTELRKLVDLLLWGINNDVPPAEGLVWSQKVNVLIRELGIEVPE